MARRWRMLTAGLLAVSGLSVGGPAAASAPATPPPAGPATEFTVLLESGLSGPAHDGAVAAIRAAGGAVLRANPAIGLLVVRAPRTGFAERVAAAPGVLGAARSRALGTTPATAATPGTASTIPATAGSAVARDQESGASGPAAQQPVEAAASTGLDPLDARLWGLRMVRSDLARQRQPGDRRVRVGVLDSGVDATHPDLAPNVDLALSRNFVVDIPYDENGAVIDGPCEFRGCVDPAGHDDYGHGTHVAGTIAAAANGFGTSGVAPNVTLVDIRGTQDSGYTFLQPFLDALTYGADIGLNVINLPFNVDPWIYNCTGNPADTPEQQLEQRTTIVAVNRALDYAHRRGVTLISPIGYTHDNLSRPNPDVISPNFPTGAAHPRQLDPATCHAMPIEGHHVIGVSGLGPSGIKADYSNYGIEHVELGGPGGFRNDGLGTPWFGTRDNQILSTYSVAAATGKAWLTPGGEITPLGEAQGMLKHCQDGACAFYRWAESTSRAAPHASGAAALVISQYGGRHGGRVSMDPDRVEHALLSTAQQRPCPTPRLVSYAAIGRPAEFDAYCEGGTALNGFYGHGIVDAFAAVTRGGR